MPARDTVKIPMNDLARQTGAIADEIMAAVQTVVSSGYFVLGPHVEAFESQFAQYCGTEFCVSTANGTDALELALQAIGTRAGDEVVCVANAGMYAATAAVNVGATPVFCDIDRTTLLMDLQSLRGAVTARTKAIIVTHLYGRMADIERICAFAAERGIPVIEDCAQAHGARLGSKKAGSWGLMGCFSFYPTKNLGALGDGGAIVTKDETVAQSLRSLRQYGWTEKYRSERSGGRNSRLDEMQAAVLSLKLRYLDQWNLERRAIAESYRHRCPPNIELFGTNDADDVAHLCVARAADRDRARERLRKFGIATEIHYPVPDHQQPSLSGLIDRRQALPNTEDAARHIFSLPCFPGMTEAEIAYVGDILTKLGD